MVCCCIRKFLFGNIRISLISFVVILISSGCGDKTSPVSPQDEAQYCWGCLTGQEVGDAFYSRLNVAYPFIKNSHTGIYFRYRGDDPNDKRNHLVIDHPGLGYPVMIRSLYDASDGDIGYWGAYNPGAYGKIGFQDRMKVLRTAIELVRIDPPIPYVLFDVLFVPDELKPLWTGETYQIGAIRCDGVVEYCYEKNGINVWGVDLDSARCDITENAANLDDHNRWWDGDEPPLWKTIDPTKNLTPDIQRGCVERCTLDATDYTFMRVSQPQDPSPVSDLRATSHNDEGCPIDPCENRIRITWTDATDWQSGIWGYYIKVDKSATSIPAFLDIPLPRVDVNDNDSLFAQRNGYQPEWTSPPLDAGIYYVHIRSVDNAGNWCEAWPWGCTSHTMPLVIE